MDSQQNATENVQSDPSRTESTGPGLSQQEDIAENQDISDAVAKAFDQVDELTKPAGEEAQTSLQNDPNRIESTGPGTGQVEVSASQPGAYTTDPAADPASQQTGQPGQSASRRNQGSGQSAPTTTEPSSQGQTAGGGVSQQEISDIVDQALDSEAPEEARSEAVRQAVEQFNGLDVDTKLAVFYYIYEGMGESVTPAALGAAPIELTQAFLDEFNALPDGEAQLEAQRALVRGDDNTLGREYGKQNENNKLAIWYLIAERMGKDVIGMPEDYKLDDIAQQNLVAVKELDFEQQITFLRDIASPMGHDPIERAV